MCISVSAQIMHAGLQPDISQQIEQKSLALNKSVSQWKKHFDTLSKGDGFDASLRKYLVDVLTTFGLEVQINVPGTGVVAVLNSTKPGPVIILSQELLSLQQSNNGSRTYYRAHHIEAYHNTALKQFADNPMTTSVEDINHKNAILLGTAALLSNMKSSLNGSIKLVFQSSMEIDSTDEYARTLLANHIDVMEGIDVGYHTLQLTSETVDEAEVLVLGFEGVQSVMGIRAYSNFVFSYPALQLSKLHYQLIR